MMFGKKKRNITFLIGCIWYYIKRIDDIEDFVIATDLITEICVKMGIDWNMVTGAEKAYQTWRDSQSGCLKEGADNG